jgi:hypothetical protein
MSSIWDYNGRTLTQAQINYLKDYLNELHDGQYVKCVKKTIGYYLRDVDFKLAPATNQNEQVFTVCTIPARCRVLDVYIINDIQFTGAVSLVADVGSASGGDQYIASATIYATGAILAMATGAQYVNAPTAAVGYVYVNITPGANWNLITNGQVSVYVTYVDVTDL